MNETSELTRGVKIKELFDLLYLNQRYLTAGQMEFIRGCKKYFDKNKMLSEKQLKILGEIMKCIPKEVKLIN